MRVISGSRKSLPLKTLSGNDTRPTTDRIKETLFNILNPYIPGCRFLDVFAGSGGIGIEALSRGAVSCCMVEKNRKAVSVIRENLKTTGFLKETRLICADAIKVFDKPGEEKYDVIFMDPPYNRGLEKEVLKKIAFSGWASDNALYVIEADADTDFSWVGELSLECIKEKRYKTNKHIFLRHG